MDRRETLIPSTAGLMSAHENPLTEPTASLPQHDNLPQTARNACDHLSYAILPNAATPDVAINRQRADLGTAHAAQPDAPGHRTPTPRPRRYCFKSGMAIVRKWNTEAASRIVAPASTAS